MRTRRFPEICAAFVGLFVLVVCQFTTFFCIFFLEVVMCGPSQLVVTLLPIVQKLGFEQVTGVHLCHKVVHFFFLGDCDPMVLAFNLAPVQLAVKGCDVVVGRVSPGLEEVHLDGEIFLVRDYVPRLELLGHFPNVLVFVTNVVFL